MKLYNDYDVNSIYQYKVTGFETNYDIYFKTRKYKSLKPKYKELFFEYLAIYDLRGGCTCFQCAPCSICTHEGNPISLESCDDAWVDVTPNKIDTGVLLDTFYYHMESGRLIYKSTKKLAGNITGGYRRIQIGNKKYREHRLIWQYFNGDIPDGYFVDHIDGDTLNNRIENLRLASPKENQYNRIGNKNRELPKGIYTPRNSNRYYVKSIINGTLHQLGSFATLAEALEVRDNHYKEHHKEFARFI